jgi:hypothetical protein
MSHISGILPAVNDGGKGSLAINRLLLEQKLIMLWQDPQSDGGSDALR